MSEMAKEFSSSEVNVLAGQTVLVPVALAPLVSVPVWVHKLKLEKLVAGLSQVTPPRLLRPPLYRHSPLLL
jgi:hypothetical protein